MKAKHTQGPWIIMDDNENGNCAVVVDSPTESYQIAGPCPRDNQRGMADMRLIAAGPQMLEELGKALELYHKLQLSARLTGLEREEIVTRCEGIKAAIEKAQGGDQ